MKKILLLGGSAQQVIAIETAKKLGYYTILCDYLDDNPGQYVADKFYLVSTTDKEAVLNVALAEKVDGVLAYASDPAAPTAAYVAEKMGLPTNPYESVKILSEKHLFRNYLKKHNFNVPGSYYFNSYNDSIKDQIKNLKFPIMVKPVDSSGSKGITKLDNINCLSKAYDYALSFSRNKIIQIEEYIQKDHEYMVGGDIFVVDGQVKFWGLLNCHRDSDVNPLVPVGKSYPLKLNAIRIELIKKEIQQLINLLNIKFGAFNIELMITSDEKLYLIEVGPRNGGNMIPDLLSMISGKDMIEATIRCAMGDYSMDMSFDGSDSVYATYNLHSDKNGTFQDIKFSEKLNKYIVKKIIYKKNGDDIFYFDGANKALGIIFMKFANENEMFNILVNINNYINIELK